MHVSNLFMMLQLNTTKKNQFKIFLLCIVCSSSFSFHFCPPLFLPPFPRLLICLIFALRKMLRHQLHCSIQRRTNRLPLPSVAFVLSEFIFVLIEGFVVYIFVFCSVGATTFVTVAGLMVNCDIMDYFFFC